ncbi:hypothetical protein B0O80DRAFT_426851 [Mortierella sp. GBAus27b]|nr:hypothetical protein B0O80DRAFT_426851 [Mortierella sp. GBAus27b]
MKISTFSIISAVLALAAVAQSAPTPAAEPPKTIPYVAVNPENKSDTHSGEAAIQPKGTEEPAAAASLRCWNWSLNGRSYSITCNGSHWWIWATCSNGYLYKGGPFSGTYSVRITCPVGSSVTRGGAYDD